MLWFVRWYLWLMIGFFPPASKVPIRIEKIIDSVSWMKIDRRRYQNRNLTVASLVREFWQSFRWQQCYERFYQKFRSYGQVSN